MRVLWNVVEATAKPSRKEAQTIAGVREGGFVKTIRRFGFFAAALSCVVIPVLSQNKPPAAKPSFEVTSIKPSGPRGGGGGRTLRGGRLSMPGATLRSLLVYGYSGNTTLMNDHIIGGPAWIDSDRFDVQAKIDCDAGQVGAIEVKLMIQSMMEDRFQLKVHLEKRELPMYDLVVGKDGPRIKPSEDQTPANASATPAPGPCAPPVQTAPPVAARGAAPFDPNGPLPRGMTLFDFDTRGNRTIRTAAVPLTNVVSLLQNQTGRIINDKTGLTGLFDVTLKFSGDDLNSPFGAGDSRVLPGLQPTGPGGAALDPVPTLTSAVQQQLGLKLESIKGAVDVLVIESVQRPTED